MWDSLVQNISNQRRLWIYIFASSVLLYFIFAPAVSIPYYASDDFRYAFGGFNKSCKSEDGFYFVMTLGRPLQAYLDCLSYKFADNLERMKMLRFFSVVLMGCGMGLLAEWLYSIGFSFLTAFFTAGSFFLIQKFYADTLTAGATSLPIAVLLAVMAYSCLQKAYAYPFIPAGKNTIKKISAYLISAGLLISALLTYPAMTFFFATLILIKILFTNMVHWARTRKEVLQEIILLCVVCLIYFVYAYINMHYHPMALIPDAYRIDHPNFNINEIIKRLSLVLQPYHPLWAILPSHNRILQGQATYILVLGGVYLGIIAFLHSDLYIQNPKRALSWLAQALLGLITVFILCNFFFLIMPTITFMEQRLLFVTVASGLVLVLWGLQRWTLVMPNSIKKGIVLSLIVGFFFIEAYQANIFMLVNALDYAKYINTARAAIDDHVSEAREMRRIHYILPSAHYPYDAFFLSNAALSEMIGRENYSLKWCSLPRGIPGEEKDHQNESLACLSQLPEYVIGVTYSYPNEAFVKTDDMLLIDMQSTDRSHNVYQYLKNYFNVDWR